MTRADPRIEELVGNAERPYEVRPERLYTRDDLMQGWRPGGDHSVTLDGRIYEYVKAHGGRAPDVEEGLAQRTHDAFIDVLLAAFLMQTGRPVVGIMGGSSTTAADPNYRRVVHLTGSLTRRGYLVVGGGGLGIMEAANLGAYLADRSDADRDEALDALAAASPWAADPARYMRVADGIRDGFAPGSESLAIPTWVIAGEPISQFASHIAKYFSNSIREDGMLAVATAGIVFAPGGAGTMQEIFQDAAQNAYRAFGRSPMAFLDTRHYCVETGLYPTLQRQAARLGFDDLLSVSDEPEQILERFPTVATLPRVDATPELMVRRMRNGEGQPASGVGSSTSNWTSRP
jgi:predicted Rossmann-fold nucleotide-binding protein